MFNLENQPKPNEDKSNEDPSIIEEDFGGIFLPSAKDMALGVLTGMTIMNVLNGHLEARVQETGREIQHHIEEIRPHIEKIIENFE